MGNELDIATRCQLLTGSYEGSKLSCSCECPKNCVFEKNQMTIEVQDYPKLIEARQRKIEEYARNHQ